MEILLNPVLVSVIFMCLLCLLRFNIIIAILVSAMVAALMSGIPIIGEEGFMGILIGGMGNNAGTALSYILLGVLAYSIQQTGVAEILSVSLEKVFGKSGKIFLLILAIISCFSQNLIPIHIAFIPILIPSLLILMNDMKLDRRAAACALTFGLKAPYIALPVGFGWIFHDIIAKNMTANNMPVAQNEIWKYLYFPALGMVIGLLIAIFITYRKPREYENIDLVAGEKNVKYNSDGSVIFETQHIGAILGCIGAFVVQVIATNMDDGGSMPLGALTGILIMLAFGAIPYKNFDKSVQGGIAIMGFIAITMMVASGYAEVIRATGGVNELVDAGISVLGGSKLLSATVMLLLGLFVTMGIGSSFSTIPILATIYVPLCIGLGFSVPATVILIGTAAALGDAGSPASDSTLGPTAGLNVDGQHDHIWDTCVPTFLHYNILLVIFGVIGAMIF